MRNTFVQGMLSIIFVTLAIVVIITAVIADRALVSRTAAESNPRMRPCRRAGSRRRAHRHSPRRALEAEWDALPVGRRPVRRALTVNGILDRHASGAAGGCAWYIRDLMGDHAYAGYVSTSRRRTPVEPLIERSSGGTAEGPGTQSQRPVLLTIRSSTS